MTAKRVAAAWLRREDWSAWKQADPTFLQPSYDAWELKMQRVVAQYEAQGVTVVKVDTGFAEFMDWSRQFAAGAVDSKARSTFAAARLQWHVAAKRDH